MVCMIILEIDFHKTNSEGNSVISKIIGGFDEHTNMYVLSIQYTQNILELDNKDYTTASFDEGVQGWTSFLSFKPTFTTSLNSSFYSFYDGKPWKHYQNTVNVDQ